MTERPTTLREAVSALIAIIDEPRPIERGVVIGVRHELWPVVHGLRRMIEEQADEDQRRGREARNLVERTGRNKREMAELEAKYDALHSEVTTVMGELEERNAALSGAVRAMARRLGHHRRWAREATTRRSRAMRERLQTLQRLGDAVGVHVGHPSHDRYQEFEDRIVAAGLRLRADRAEERAQQHD